MRHCYESTLNYSGKCHNLQEAWHRSNSNLRRRQCFSCRFKKMDPSMSRFEGVTPRDSPATSAGEDHDEDSWVTLNVGGLIYETQLSTLKKVPGSRLADLQPGHASYDSTRKEFRFDRNPYFFQYILDFFRTGELHVPNDVCGPNFRKELEFWGIDEEEMSDCCWGKYNAFDAEQKTMDTMKRYFAIFDTNSERNQIPEGSNKLHIWRQRCWIFLQNPRSSILAQVCALFYILMVLLSLFVLCVDTHEDFRVLDPSKKSNDTNKKMYLLATTTSHPAILYIELITNLIFTLDIILRFIVCPDKIKFIRSVLNWMDLVSILAQWVTAIRIVAKVDTERDVIQHILATLRVLRVSRVFKLSRHHQGLRILLLVLRASIKELFLLIILMFIGMYIFATLIYYAELKHPTNYANIPLGFWWAIITMTTVGYGDTYPTTHWGYLIGTLCALCGMLVTGLPIPIIANKFNLFYNYARMAERASKRKLAKKEPHLSYKKRSFSLFKPKGAIVYPGSNRRESKDIKKRHGKLIESNSVCSKDSGIFIDSNIQNSGNGNRKKTKNFVLHLNVQANDANKEIQGKTQEKETDNEAANSTDVFKHSLNATEMYAVSSRTMRDVRCDLNSTADEERNVTTVVPIDNNEYGPNSSSNRRKKARRRRKSQQREVSDSDDSPMQESTIFSISTPANTAILHYSPSSCVSESPYMAALPECNNH